MTVVDHTTHDIYHRHCRECRDTKRPLDIRAVDTLSSGGLFRHGNKAFGALTNMPPVLCKAKIVRGVRIAMRDGVSLMQDIVFGVNSKGEFGAHPTVIVRTPYNRKFLTALGTTFAVRGFHVILQDCRGTGESGGTPEVLALEHDDGADTAAWTRQQSWFQPFPKLAMWGVSFLGIVGYAAVSAGAQVDAIVPILCASDLYSLLRPGEGGYALSLVTRWHYLTCKIDPTMSFSGLIQRLAPGAFRKGTKDAFAAPLCEVDKHVAKLDSAAGPTPLGAMIEQHLQDEPDSEFWRIRTYKFCPQQVDVSAAAAPPPPRAPGPLSYQGSAYPAAAAPLRGVASAPCAKMPQTPPASIVAGWYDIFCRESLKDYQRFCDAGAKPLQLTIGPWCHFDLGPAMSGMREGMWFLVNLFRGEQHTQRLAGSSMDATAAGSSVGGGVTSRRGSVRQLFSRSKAPGPADAAGSVMSFSADGAMIAGSYDAASVRGGAAAPPPQSSTGSGAQRPFPGCTIRNDDPFDASVTMVKSAPHRRHRRDVMVYIVGAKASGRRGASPWVEFNSFPPRAAVPTPFYLSSQEMLMAAPTVSQFAGSSPARVHRTCVACKKGGGRPCDSHAAAGSTAMKYSPSDPTPTVGGVDFGHDAGKKDLTKLEQRDDVIVFTTSPATAPLTMCGMVYAEVSFTSTTQCFDLVMRLSKVDSRGKKSLFNCEGYRRVGVQDCVAQGSGRYTGRVTVDMWATGLHVAAGESLRVSISPASHPKYVRNFGHPDVDVWTCRHDDDCCSHEHTVHILHDVSAGEPSKLVLPLLPVALFP